MDLPLQLQKLFACLDGMVEGVLAQLADQYLGRSALNSPDAEEHSSLREESNLREASKLREESVLKSMTHGEYGSTTRFTLLD